MKTYTYIRQWICKTGFRKMNMGHSLKTPFSSKCVLFISMTFMLCTSDFLSYVLGLIFFNTFTPF